jgi:hypothetical protein
VACKRKVRLTVARRRRHCTVFPSTKSAVKVEGLGPLWVAKFGGLRPPVEVVQQNYAYLPKSVTRGLPEEVISTLSGAWKTCSSKSR